jgi:hypothetical protein
MKISALMRELRRIKKEHGDIEVTCTHSVLPEKKFEIFETTVEHTEVHKHPTIGECVRLWL